MAYPKTYKTEKGVYEIPEKESASFLKDFPNAMEVVSYKMGKDTFDIPVKETEVFLKENPQAVPLKKKEPSEPLSKEPLDGGLDGTISTNKEPIPTIELYKTPSGGLVDDPFTRVKKSKDLSQRKRMAAIPSSGKAGEVFTEVPDEGSIKEAENITSELEGEGFGKDFIEAVSDMPEAAFRNPTTSKETLINLYGNNPVKFKQLTNEAKIKYAIQDAAAQKSYNELEGDKQRDEIAKNIGILEGNKYSGDEQMPESMQQFYDIVRQKQGLIDKNIDDPEQKKKYHGLLRQTYAPAISPESLDFKEEYQQSGLGGAIDINQYAGLKTLELFEPEKYKTYLNVVQDKIVPQWNVNVQTSPEGQTRGIVTDSLLAEKLGGTISQLTTNQRIGKEEVLRELALMGANNEYDDLTSQQNDLKQLYKDAETDEQRVSIITKSVENENRMKQLEQVELENDKKYPLTAKLKYEKQVKEIVDDIGMGVGGFMYNRYAHGVGTGVDAVENLVTNIFGSESDKTKLRVKRIGEGKQFEADTYLPESERRTGSPVIIQASDELKKKAKEIINGRSLSSLSDEERQQLNNLIANNQSQIKTITNPEAGKSKNFLSKATGLSIAGFTADIGAFLTKMGMLQGVGLGAKAAEATTLFTDGYDAAYNKKISEGASSEDAHEYGILHGAVLSLMTKFGSKYETIMNTVKGGKSPLSKYIAGLSEKQWNKLAGEAEPLLKRVGKTVKGVAKEQGKMIGTFGIAAPTLSSLADNAFYDQHKSVSQMASEADTSAEEMLIGSAGFIGLGLVKGAMKSKASPLEKMALWELGDNPELGIARIDEAVKKNEITSEEGTQKKEIIERVSKLIPQVPETTDKGKVLDDQQRIDYLYRLALKESYKEKSKILPEKQAEEAKQKALVIDKENQIELEGLTEKQINDRKDKLGKAISKVDDKGKPELSDKEMADAKAELEAINNTIEKRKDSAIEGEPEKIKQPIELSVSTKPADVQTDKGKMEGSVTDKIEVNDVVVALPEKGFVISDVTLNKGEEKGKGSGQEIYKKALDEYGTLYSSFPISEDAMRVQNKLVEKGIAKIETITLSDGTEIRKITKAETKTIPSEETKIPIPKEERGITEGVVSKGVYEAGTGKEGKFEEKARKLAEKIMATDIVPDWLKIDDPNVKKSGADAETIKKALADATIKMGKLLDKGVEFGEAVKEAVKDLVDLMGEGMRGKIEEGFAKDYEGKLNDLSGIKKGLVSDKIIEGVDLERVGDKEMMALGRKILDTGEVKPEALVTKIITDGKGVLTPTEVVGLITYKRDIDNALQDTYKKLAEKKANGEDVGTLAVEAKNLERQQNDFDVMAVITAQQQSMAFRLRQRMLDREYNVVTQIEKYKANNDGNIPADVEAKFRDLDKQLKEVKAKLVEAEKIVADKEAQDAVNNIKESVDREKTFTEEELEKKVQEGVESEISKLYEQLPAEKKSAADKAISAIEKFRAKIKNKTYESTLGIPMAIADLGAATAIRAIKVGKSVAEAVRIGIDRIKKELEKKGIKKWDGEAEYIKDLTETLESEGVSTKKQPKDKPTINEDGTVSIPNEMLRDLVKRGVTDINDLVSEVHKEIKKDLPNITERQVRDYITDYGKKVNPTADEIQTQVNTAKRVGRLLSELEDVHNKIKKQKGSTGNKLTDKERELKRKINSLSKDIFGKEEKPAEQRLSEAKERIRQRISDLTAKIKKKDFAKPVKKLPVTDTELVELKKQQELLQEEYDKEQYKLELKNRKWWQKAEDIALEIFTGISRTLVAGVDLSAGLVQGSWRLYRDPNMSMKAFGESLKQFASEKRNEEWFAKLKASGVYPIIKASKLAVTDEHGSVSVKEGLFITNWANAIYNGIANVVTLGYKPAANWIKQKNPIKASQRAFDGYINYVRVANFSKLAEQAHKDGYTFESDPKIFEKLADHVNTTTGRGSMGALETSSKWLSVAMFAPRKVISEVKLFTPYLFVYYAKQPSYVRKKALLDFAKFVGSYVSVNAAIWAASNAYKDDDDETKFNDNFWNMNSSDFMTHKFGDTRVQLGGQGAKSALVFMSRLFTGKFTNQYGQTTTLGERYGKRVNTELDLTIAYLKGKASPGMGALLKKMDVRKGDEVDDVQLAQDLTVPMWMQDAKALYKEHPAAIAAMFNVLSILGAGVRIADKNTSQVANEEFIKNNPDLKVFIDKGISLPEYDTEKISTKYTNGKSVSKLSEQKPQVQQDYITKHQANYKSELIKLKNGTYKVYKNADGGVHIKGNNTKEAGMTYTQFKDLTDDQIKYLEGQLTRRATVKTKKALKFELDDTEKTENQ